MQIQNLKLLNFRNYNQLAVTFDNHLNIIYGKNGSGKTNLVEAIYVLAITRSFRQINDKTLIKSGTNLTKIEGMLNDEFQTTFKIIINNDGKKVKINNNKITRISDYVSKINVVLFNPNDLKMIKDTPSIRRKYLNIGLSQLHIEYLKKLNDYNKLLKIRNAYLKQMYLNGNAMTTYLQVITEKLIDSGLEIYQMRENYLKNLNLYLKDIYKKIALDGDLVVQYDSDYQNKSRKELINLYNKNLKRDLAFGKTNIGIHHDDFHLYLDEYDLKDYGSEGQQKNAVIAWKFSEICIFKKEKNVTPILILDDLLSELDVEKIKNILQFIEQDIQTFITTTEIEKLSFLLKDKNYKKFFISNGLLEEVE